MAEQRQTYDPKGIEPKWQEFWQSRQVFRAKNPGDTDFDPQQPKFYALDMFPYPSGAGLHVGHPEGYTATDIVSRYKRAKGFNVLHPMGWDAFGLPAEQYAIQTNQHPAATTKANVDNFRRQLQALGFSYDWDREVGTCDPSFFKWTQWIFKRLYERGLAYESNAPVWWCEALGTVLSNDEVINGRSERGDHPCERRPLRQWVLKITEYAERLLRDLDQLDWTDSLKAMQREWIGRSEGAEIEFDVIGHEGTSLRVFTTRPDTLFGASFMVVGAGAPARREDHERHRRSGLDGRRLRASAASAKSELERTDLAEGQDRGVHRVATRSTPLFAADDPRGSACRSGSPTTSSSATARVRSWPCRPGTSATSSSRTKFGLSMPAESSQPSTDRRRPSATREVARGEDVAGADDRDRLRLRLHPFGTAEGQIDAGRHCRVSRRQARQVADWLQEPTGSASRRCTYRIRDWLFSAGSATGVSPSRCLHTRGRQRRARARRAAAGRAARDERTSSPVACRSRR